MPTGDKILAIVPWPTSSEKNSKISPKIDDFSSHAEVASKKKVESMHADRPYKWAKVHPNRFNFRDFSSKKTNFELAPMH